MSNTEDNEYKTSILAYSRELNSLVSTNCITRSPEEEESLPPHTKKVVMDSEKEMTNSFPTFQGYATTNSKDMTLAPTPQFVMGSNKLNDSPMELNLTQYILNKFYKRL